MIYQTLHTPPITPEESGWLETVLQIDEGVKTDLALMPYLGFNLG